MATLYYPQRRRVRSFESRFKLNRRSPFTRGLVGWWPFGYISGSEKLFGLSPYRHVGDWAGTGTHWITDAIWGAVGNFNGSDDNVELPSVTLTFGNAWTIAVWGKAVSKSYLGDGAGYARLYVYPETGVLYIANDVNALETFAPSVPLIGNWRLVVLRGDGHVFIDGLDEFAYSSGGTFTLRHLGQGYSTYYYSGQLANMARWSRHLSTTEILKWYNDTRDGSHGDLAIPLARRLWPLPSGIASPLLKTVNLGKALINTGMSA